MPKPLQQSSGYPAVTCGCSQITCVLKIIQLETTPEDLIEAGGSVLLTGNKRHLSITEHRHPAPTFTDPGSTHITRPLHPLAIPHLFIGHSKSQDMTVPTRTSVSPTFNGIWPILQIGAEHFTGEAGHPGNIRSPAQSGTGTGSPRPKVWTLCRTPH